MKRNKKSKTHKYNTFWQDTKAIIIPRPLETCKVSMAVLMTSILFGLFFVGIGRCITLLLSYIF